MTNFSFDSRYEPLCGVDGGFLTFLAHGPGAAIETTTIVFDQFSTKLGPMFAAATDHGLCMLEFADRRLLATEFEDLRKRQNAVIVPGTNKHVKLAKNQLAEFLEGQRRQFELALDPQGPDFQRKVWNVLTKIPYGKTWSYLMQAKELGMPKSVRAVANANCMNKIVIVIPCHRVIGSDGSLTGYGGGLPRKKWLLELEKLHRRNE